MTLIKFNPIERDLKQFSHIVDELFGKDMVNFSKPIRTIKPAVNIKETNETYVLSLAAPGLKREDFKINLDQDQLTISHEKEETTKDEKVKVIRKEFDYSSFKRTFTLPITIDQSQITASYNNGILQLNFPKKEVEAPKTIEIK